MNTTNPQCEHHSPTHRHRQQPSRYTVSGVTASAGLSVSPSSSSSLKVNPVPAIYSVSGCPIAGPVWNGTADCTVGITIFLIGEAIPSLFSLYLIGPQAVQAQSVRWFNASTVSAVLPTLSASSMLRTQVLRIMDLRTFFQFDSPPLLSYSINGPYVMGAAGCAVNGPGNTTSGCRAGMRLTVYGRNFSDRAAVFLNSSSFPCAGTIVVSSEVIVCAIPLIFITGGLVTVQVVSAGIYYSNAAPLVTFANILPSVERVTGCTFDDPMRNSTSGCWGGQEVTIYGREFISVTEVRLAFGLQYVCWNVVVLSPTQLTCTLPNIQSGSYAQYYSVSVMSTLGSAWSPGLISFGNLGPAIERIEGCAIAGPGNGTSGCNGGDFITLHGSAFPPGPLYLYIGILNAAKKVTWVSSTVVTAVLPYISSIRPWNASIQLYGDKGYYTPLSPAFLGWLSQTPVVLRVSGCSDNGPLSNSTSMCMTGMKLTIRGQQFLNRSQDNELRVTIGFSQGLFVVWINITTITCVLDSVDPSYSGQLLPLTVYSSLGASDPVNLLTYWYPGPIIDRVTGCTTDVRNSTSNCDGGRLVTILGRNFTAMDLRVYVSTTRYPCTGVELISSSKLTCFLPFYPAQTNTNLQIFLYSGGVISNKPYSVTYQSQTPTITTVTGCRSMLSGVLRDCIAGDVVTITGYQLFNSSLLVNVSTYHCEPVVWINSTLITCVLPLLPATLWRSNLRVQVWASGLPGFGSGWGELQLGRPSGDNGIRMCGECRQLHLQMQWRGYLDCAW